MSGCTAHHVKIDIDKSYQVKKNTKVKVNDVINKTGKKYDLEIEDMLKVAFEKQLKENNLLVNGDNSPTIVLNTNIIKYEEGNAFKRWLWPSWGATELTIEAKLYSSGKEIGNLTATKKITGGGLYSIGQWSVVFNTVAEEVIEDFRKKLNEDKV